jgi:hypothetical protein
LPGLIGQDAGVLRVGRLHERDVFRKLPD